MSSRQFVSEGLITDVTEVLAETGLPGEALRIELTESAFMRDPAGARAAPDQLRELGVRFLIDDFGTGYSSLAQLSELAFEMIKIDRSFVARLEDSDDDGEIVRAIVGLAHNLGRRVIAEGVETEGQAQRLRHLDVDLDHMDCGSVRR